MALNINGSVGPDSLTPTLLVSGTLLKLGVPTDKAIQSKFQRAIASINAYDLMSVVLQKKRGCSTFHAYNWPEVINICKILVSVLVLVCCLDKY